MKLRIAMVMTVIVVLTTTLGWHPLAQEPGQHPDPDTGSPNVMRGSRIIGIDVYNNADAYLGEVADLAISREGNDLEYVVLNYGSVLGMGGKYIAIPFDAFTLDVENRWLRLDVTEQRLEQLDGFEWDGRWPDNAEWQSH